jgi:glutaminyl-tRNA synthetase
LSVLRVKSPPSLLHPSYLAGYPAAAIRLFCERMGVSKSENNIDMSVLEDCVRDTLGTVHPSIQRALASLITINHYYGSRICPVF